MCYSLERNEESELAVLTFFGGVRLEDRESALYELENLFTETGWRKVLVDLSSSRSTTRVKLRGALRHAWRLTELQSTRTGVRVAYVFPDDQPPVLELIAASRGYVFERFASRSAALGWLQALSSIKKAANPDILPAPTTPRDGSSTRVSRSYA